MQTRNGRSPGGSYKGADRELDDLILRLRRLLAHRGYDRSALLSPMLKRILPVGRLSGDPLADAAELRRRLEEARLDAKTVAYITESVETELDFARLRLT